MHVVILPVIAWRSQDAARHSHSADPHYGYQRFGDIIDELSTTLTAHLAHEETAGLPLIDASLTPAEWQHFAQIHGERNLPDASTYLPWLLAGARPQVRDAILGKFPPHLLAAYREQWSPAYAALEVWPASANPAPQNRGARENCGCGATRCRPACYISD